MPEKCQNGNCTPWKMTRNNTPEMTENAQLELPEWKMHNLENARMEIAHPGK